MGKKKRRQEAEIKALEAAAAKKTREDRAPEATVPRLAGTAKWKLIAVCLLVFVTAFAVYANTLKGDFIWDDEYLILNNSQIKSFQHLPNVFKTYVGYGSENINNFYRPIQEISNMVDYFLWGRKPFGFHLTNVLLHSLVALMVCVFLFYVSGSLVVAGPAALLYAVHPVHTEAVAYIAGRADSLYSIFMLISLVLFMRFSDAPATRASRTRYVFSLGFFILSILSKEIALITPLLILLYLFYFKRGGEGAGIPRSLRWSWAPFAAVVVVYGWLRLTVLSFSDVAPGSVFGQIPLVFRLVTFFRTVLVYFGLLAVPRGLHMERVIPISTTVFDAEAILAIAVIAVLGSLAWWTFKKNRLVSFGIAWFFLNLLPVSNIVPINSFLAEHWLYMASVGIFLIFGLGVDYVYTRMSRGNIVIKAALMLALAAMTGFYAWGTVLRNVEWKDEISFFTSTLKYHPRNARLYLNLGNTYYEKGDTDNAIAQYRKAIEINRNYAVAYGNIGSAYLHKGDPAQAEEYLRKAVSFQEKYPIAHYNLGMIQHQKGSYTEALKELKIATEQLPPFFQAWNMLGRTYLKLNMPAEAKAAFQKSLSIMPNQDTIREVLKRMDEIKSQ